MLPKETVCLLLISLSIVTVVAQINGSSLPFQSKDRFVTQNRNSFDRAVSTSPKYDSKFDPDVLHRFLEEYASKMKPTTEHSNVPYDDELKLDHEGQDFESVVIGINLKNNTKSDDSQDVLITLNDTIKKHKLYNGDSHSDNRNNGWVTLDAIPWSKSKISKWQANPTTQIPWPDSKPWDKPSFSKPWNTEFPSKPPSYEGTKPWQNKLTKPHWSDNLPTTSIKPWYSQDRPHPIQQHVRPSYPVIDKYEASPNQAQKWPPERPAWDRYSESSRPSSDIITDNGPPNFPNSNWDRLEQRPGYTHHTESYVNQHGGWNDRNDFTNNNNFNRPINNDGYYEGPYFSHYQYPNNNDRPSNHPSSGDGQWVLLSTNRGYSKSRQRSIKLDSLINSNANSNNGQRNKQMENNRVKKQHVPAITSKRQVRLTVLPPINGTNTTTSHGGLLEVERTFKTVDQSQKEHEMEKSSSSNGIKSTPGILINRRPIRDTLIGVAPSSSAVLAAVGAGMVPATLAMMIPMMLGKRRKRSIVLEEQMPNIRVPKDISFREAKKRRI